MGTGPWSSWRGGSGDDGRISRDDRDDRDGLSMRKSHPKFLKSLHRQVN